jgi:hypothetical protein
MINTVNATLLAPVLNVMPMLYLIRIRATITPLPIKEPSMMIIIITAILVCTNSDNTENTNLDNNKVNIV